MYLHYSKICILYIFLVYLFFRLKIVYYEDRSGHADLNVNQHSEYLTIIDGFSGELAHAD